MSFPPHASESAPQKVEREQSTFLTDVQAESLCIAFASGLDSGAGYVRIVSMLEQQRVNKEAVDNLRKAISMHGDSLFVAFERCGLLDVHARALLGAAERQGNLPAVFRDLAANYSRRHARKKRIVNAFVESIFFLSITLFFLLPIISEMKGLVTEEDLVGPIASLAMMGALKTLLFFGLYGGLAFIWLNLPVDMKLRDRARRLLLKIPIISDAGRWEAVATFTRFLERSISAGMSVFEGLQLAVQASHHPHLLRRLDAMLATIRQGQTLTAALAMVPDLPKELLHHVQMGEETGLLTERLDEMSTKLEHEAQEKFDRMLSVFIYSLRLVIIILVLAFGFYTIVTTLGEGFLDEL